MTGTKHDFRRDTSSQGIPAGNGNGGRCSRSSCRDDLIERKVMNLEEYRTLPHEMKLRALGSALRSLDCYDVVEIRRERDIHTINKTGEDIEKWEVGICVGRRNVDVESRDLCEAIIEAEHAASAAHDEESMRREATRKAALAKLSPEEQRVLRLA